MRSVAELLDLSGRTALITGAAGHIGRAVADAFAQCGAHVALLDTDEKACCELASQLTSTHKVRCFGLAIDLADDAATHAAPKRIAEELGGLDILVNNAGFVGTSGLSGWVTDFSRQSTETWRKALEVNLTAPFTLCREAAPFLAASGKGSIINMGSIYGFLGPDLGLYEGTSMGNPAAYAASKGGLIQFTRWLATVLAPQVRVNCVSPGGVWRNQPEAFVQRYEARTPLGRMGTEEDMIGAVLFLAWDLSAYVTGQHIAVDGGFGAW